MSPLTQVQVQVHAEVERSPRIHHTLALEPEVVQLHPGSLLAHAHDSDVAAFPSQLTTLMV